MKKIIINGENVYYAIRIINIPEDKYDVVIECTPYFVYENAEGKRCVFYFEATEKMLKLCRNYNSSHTVITKVRY